MTKIRQLGLLTGGGDCPGLNPVIRAVTRRALEDKIKVLGIRNGWKGLVEGHTMSLDLRSVSGIRRSG